jgi:hypothetical protein
VEGSNGNYKAVQGTERIPDNWVCTLTRIYNASYTKTAR